MRQSSIEPCRVSRNVQTLRWSDPGLVDISGLRKAKMAEWTAVSKLDVDVVIARLAVSSCIQQWPAKSNNQKNNLFSKSIKKALKTITKVIVVAECETMTLER